VSGQPREGTRRLFFALWPSNAERQALTAATQAHIEAAQGRAVPLANLHLTLAFLGEVAAARLAELADLGRQVAASWQGPTPIALSFERLACWRRPQILCVLERVAGAPAALLADTLKSAALAAGFAPDLKPFRAHVTVARKVVQLRSAAAIEKVTWESAALALVESTGGGAGPLYSVLESQLLGKNKKVHEKH
jgi:RNA 2',3'-cyclic 3'-phosphodiesterase